MPWVVHKRWGSVAVSVIEIVSISFVSQLAHSMIKTVSRPRLQRGRISTAAFAMR